MKDSHLNFPRTGHEILLEVEENSFWFRHRNRVVLSLISHWTRDQKIWDIGGGNGFMAKAIQDQGWDITLVEPFVEACSNAKKRGLLHIQCAQLSDLPLSQPLANVLACDVIEHIDGSLDFCKDLFERMQVGGHLIVTVPAHNYLWSNEDILAQHKRRYSRESLVLELESAGFSTQYCSYFFGFLQLPIFLLRALPYKLGLGKSNSKVMNSKVMNSNQTKPMSDLEYCDQKVAANHNPKLIKPLIDFLLEKELFKIQNRIQLNRGASLVGWFKKL